MIFIKHSLITITILVIAILVMPATSVNTNTTQKREICKHLLKNYCGFNDNRTDYISLNFNSARHSPAFNGQTVLDYLQSVLPEPMPNVNLDNANSLFVKGLSRKFLTVIISDAIDKDFLNNYNLHNAIFKHNFSFILPNDPDIAKRFIIFAFAYIVDSTGLNKNILMYGMSNTLTKTIVNQFSNLMNLTVVNSEEFDQLLTENTLRAIETFITNCTSYINQLFFIHQNPVTIYCEKTITDEKDTFFIFQAD